MSEQRHAVLIASSKYRDDEKASLPSLRCPEADVDGLNNILIAQNIGPFKTVVVKNEPHNLTLRKLSRVLKNAKKQDLVLLYYSGHGIPDESGNLYLATTDTVREDLETTSIPMAMVKQLIDNSPPAKTILILDCCYSGAASGAFFKGAVKEQIRQMFSEARGTCVLTASTDREVAREDAGEQYSLFTEHIIRGLESGEPDTDGRGYVTVDDLYTYVRERMPKNQTPTKFGNVIGDLIITKSPRVRATDQPQRIKKLLFDLGQKDAIPDFIVSEALKINGLNPSELSGKERDYYSLLEQLLSEDKKPGDFVAEWTRIGFAYSDTGSKTTVPLQNAAGLRVRKMLGPHLSDSTAWTRPRDILRREGMADMVSWYSPQLVLRHAIGSIIQMVIGRGRRVEINGSDAFYDYATSNGDGF